MREPRHATSKRAAKAAQKSPSRTTTLASRFNNNDKGSMLLLPTVAQWSSTNATLACRKAGVYS
jgi:hypothetical protein